MSDNEIHRGRLVPMDVDGDTFEEQCENACNALGYKRSKLDDNWEECFRENCYRDAYIFKGVIYKVEDEEMDPYGFSSAKMNSDGTIDYHVMYYNGGCSFDEALDSAVENI